VTNDNGSATQRLIDALGDPDRLFDQDQLVFLMGTAMRWGYEAAAAEMAADPMSWAAGLEQGYRQRCAEENEGYPSPPYLLVAGIKVGGDQRAAREAVAADRTQRYAGGPVEVWDADRPDPVRDPRPMRVRKVDGLWTWAEQL
jgi:hypothetical protein